MDFGQTHKSRRWQFADRIGAMASFLCALHCAALPFVLALLPLVGLGFLADHRFERGFVLFACVLASFALGRGFVRNRLSLPLLLAAPGVALLLLGVIWISSNALLVHSVLVTCGGLLLAGAHYFNLRNERRAQGAHRHAASCAH